MCCFLPCWQGGVFWYDSYTDTRTDTFQWLPRSLENVASMHVFSPGGSYSLTTEDGTWVADVPGASWNVKAHVKRNKVIEYLIFLSDLSPTKYIADVDQDGFGNYGLDEPDYKVIIKFFGKGGEPLTIKLSVDETGRVFGWNSGKSGMVFEFDGKALPRLAQPAGHFLDDYIFRFDEALVDRVQLVQPFGSSWLVEKDNSGFVFRLPGLSQGQAGFGFRS